MAKSNAALLKVFYTDFHCICNLIICVITVLPSIFEIPISINKISSSVTSLHYSQYSKFQFPSTKIPLFSIFLTQGNINTNITTGPSIFVSVKNDTNDKIANAIRVEAELRLENSNSNKKGLFVGADPEKDSSPFTTTKGHRQSKTSTSIDWPSKGRESSNRVFKLIIVD